MFYPTCRCERNTAKSRASGAQPRQGHAVRLVAQPVHGLRAPLHVLLRARLRAARRPAVRRRYGLSIRVKANVAEVLRRELGRAVLAGRVDRHRRGDRPVPAGRGPLPAHPRAASRCSPRPANPFHIITRGPLIVRDVDVLAEASRRADVGVSFSVPTLDEDVWRTHRAGHGAAAAAAPRALGARRGGRRRAASGWRRSCPASRTGPSS